MYSRRGANAISRDDGTHGPRVLNGGCLCGGVRYRVDAAPGALVYCHCSLCRKAQGVGFAANVPVPQAAMEITRGADQIGGFRASTNKTRYFCRVCGSPLYSQVDAAAQVRLRAGTLDNMPALTPTAHIYATSAAPWCPISDELPRHAGREPGRD